MANLADLRTAIQHRGYAQDTEDAQTELVNAEYRRLIGTRRWWWLEVAADTSLTCTVGTEAYSLASITDFLHIDAVRLEDGTNRFTLAYASPQAFRDVAHELRDNAPPVFWTRINSDLYLWPRPDKEYVISVDYVKNPPNLSDDADTPVLPAAYHDLLVWGAVRQLTFRERDKEAYSLANGEYQSLLADMKHQDGLAQRQSSSEVAFTGEVDAVNSRYSQWEN